MPARNNKIAPEPAVPAAEWPPVASDDDAASPAPPRQKHPDLVHITKPAMAEFVKNAPALAERFELASPSAATLPSRNASPQTPSASPPKRSALPPPHAARPGWPERLSSAPSSSPSPKNPRPSTTKPSSAVKHPPPPSISPSTSTLAPPSLTP
ncbi:hypothetical protein WOLCODRAFT_167073 [Wolfiporia cocos MD-104 SS10]|uniref:Uncharacterized protein n=1 Tax=Wolfiporia cocos (strain MD-104) TaxID=742152 RepID=A0A2H3J4U9_WOLCO|nr:hypothetical protein WOLCODRAFT_167073 [Wolfiporia cocos MD-104 SS10]